MRRTDLPGASHLHTPGANFCMTVFHFHPAALPSVTTTRHHTNHTAAWCYLTTVLHHLMAMINFHTTVLHFHTTVLHFHTAVFHFYTAPSRLCLAQEVPHKRSAGGLGNLIRPFALQNTCLVVQTPVWLCKTPVWLCKHPLGCPENQNQRNATSSSSTSGRL